MATVQSDGTVWLGTRRLFSTRSKSISFTKPVHKYHIDIFCMCKGVRNFLETLPNNTKQHQVTTAVTCCSES